MLQQLIFLPLLLDLALQLLLATLRRLLLLLLLLLLN